MSEFYCSGNIEARSEYNQSEQDKFEECEILTELLDELIAASKNIDSNRDNNSNVGSTLTVDDKQMHISRRYHCFEADKLTGWAWPLVEKSLEIKYEHSKTAPTHETYSVIFGTIIHQTGVNKNPLLDRYEIEYYGPQRQSLVTSIEEPNLVDDKEASYIRRETTPYDHGQLFDQLQSFMGLIAAQALEDSHAAE
jgi:hypothetical protein